MESENVTLSRGALFCLPKQSRVDIEFQDLTYTVPQGRKGSKIILRSVSGRFVSGQLTAILGPSGAGKSTLLNTLAGYKFRSASGQILINGKPRHLKEFRQLSRYILQEDLVQPMLTVKEAMIVAANLKLGFKMTRREKLDTIAEILDVLRLSKTADTMTTSLSGGEKKRLSIALELLNNPPVLFLDEPTTGLDDLSCTQCVHLLKQIAQGGRTIICSIHTPGAKLFSCFDNVYVMSLGQCIYQGFGPNVVPYLSSLGLECPTHYNPADFIIEVASGEYGDFQDRLVSAMDNGRNLYKIVNEAKDVEVHRKMSINAIYTEETGSLLQSKIYTSSSLEWYMQYRILLSRMWVQMWRDKCYLLLRVVLYILIGLLVGNVYYGMGKDGSKTIFVFGFYFTSLIFFMYIPMMPVLLQFPKEFQLIKREHFNKWYRLSAYFAALTTSTLPVQIILGSIYIVLVYVLSDQPMDLMRFSMFYLVCMLTSIISESMGLLIAAQLDLLSAMFIGPVISVPFMLLAVYGVGTGYEVIPTWIKIAMYFSYLRYSLEGLINAMLEGRGKLDCPASEPFCIYTDLDYFIKEMGMKDTIYWVDIVALIVIYMFFRGSSYYLLRQRLMPNKTFIALEYIGRLIKSQFAR